jgi:hypothetical protein
MTTTATVKGGSGSQTGTPSEQALLSVMCFLDTKEIQGLLMSAPALASVDLADFPNDTQTYLTAITGLMASGSITAQLLPLQAFRISDDIKAKTLEPMTEDQRLSAFNAAVALFSSSWPFMDTYNMNSVERLRTVRQYAPHIVALQENCLDPVLGGFTPDMAFCKLLHEEAW